VIKNNMNEIPSGVQQLLDAHTQIVQMMSQNIASNNGNLPHQNQGSKEFEDGVVTSRRACKICGEIGHTSKECCEQCPHCDTSHPNGECPVTHVSCFLCEGTTHVPAQCHLFPKVQRMNQQAKDGICQSIGKIHDDTGIKIKGESEVKLHETTLAFTTKCCYTCGEEGHISSNCTRKRERLPTYVVEFEDQELEDLLALGKPKKKKKRRNNSKEKEISQVLCYNCKEPGHYASHCLGKKKNKAKEQEEEKCTLNKDSSQVECHECQKLGHYSWDCLEKMKGKGDATRDYVVNKKRKKDLTKVVCFKCKNKGHYSRDCQEKRVGNGSRKTAIYE
jgi:cellular nucleic acid-binding protein